MNANRLPSINIQHAAYFSKSTSLKSTVDKQTLARLRKETGFTFSNCRKALVLYDSDFDKVWAIASSQCIVSIISYVHGFSYLLPNYHLLARLSNG